MNNARKPFGRPKQYKLHHDDMAYIPDARVVSQEYGRIRETASPAIAAWLEDKSTMLHNHPTFFTKVAASFNDPRCAYYVLDAMVKARRGSYLRPSYVAAYLSQSCPQFYWDAGMVGRIMAGIWGACVEAYSVPQGAGDPHVSEDKWLPVAKGRDTKGVYYVVDPKGGNEGFIWLMEARRLMYTRSQMQMQADMIGSFDRNMGKATQAADFYTEVFGWPVRTREAFMAQLAPDTPFTSGPDVSEQKAPAFGAV